MKKLLVNLVEIDAIQSTYSRSEFNEQELERIARQVLSCRGVINPILLKRINLLKFEVLDGHFEYYAAVKAKELDHTFDEVQAIILPEDEAVQAAIIEQYKELRKSKSNGDSYREFFLEIQQTLSQIQTDIHELKTVLQALSQLQADGNNPIKNHITKKVLPPPPLDYSNLIDAMNTLDERALEDKLSYFYKGRYPRTQAKKVIDARCQKPFATVEDLRRIFGKDKLAEMRKNWDKTHP
ncbi:MAG: hypothetical protein RMK91_07765 [Pseudanabaenaceae cyanobacterium SKYGB_i_bin29]|nr:hypothetical protein [Pseudanabaenaceae cyanobacterium SKYG29]MDW8421749.1 hypothetical protein [Pseudanabaenaceae cyanobacterium SKYGB_i_bin29]